MKWIEQCREWVRKYDPVTPEYLASPTLNHYAFVRALSEKLPSNAIITSDTGGNLTMMGHCFQSKEGQRIFSSSGNSAMGFSVCGAMGAWFAQPDRPIICLVGDGGAQLNIQEWQTIKHYNIKIKIFIINNRILGTTKSYQRVNKKKELACGPDGYSAPDFCNIACAYGLRAVVINNAATQDRIIEGVLANDEAVVCDVIHDDFCTYEPRMSRWDSAVNEMYPPLAEEEFLANCINPPLEGWEKRR